MAVAAQSVNHRAQSADPSTNGLAGRRLIDLREGGGVLAGSYVYEGDRLVTGYHWHDLHQIEYAVRGVVEVDTDGGRSLLPPHQAAWIPAGCLHQATLHADVRTISVLFAPDLVPDPGASVRVIEVSPLLREMILHAVRWPVTRPDSDERADLFFRTLALVVGEALHQEAALSLPTSADPVVAGAIAHTRAHLTGVTLRDVCTAVGTSERTLRRRFVDEVGMSWRTYLLRARLLHAMSLLAEPDHTVLDVSIAVGFDSVSSFTRAFRRETGESPSAYRRRVAA
jgi:AraC-like DNA-binding protein/quercetin dioxygenase-like cupin family protein